MAVVSVAPRRDPAPTAVRTVNGTEYDVVYYVATDSPLDGPQVVLSSPLLPAINSPYAVPGGNDADPHSFLASMSPKAIDATKWEVTCKYAPGDEAGLNQEGTPVEDPLSQQPLVEITWQQFVRPVAEAEFRRIGVGLRQADEEALVGGLNVLGPDDSPVYRRGQRGLPKNSAGDVFNPPLEMDDARMLIRITRNETANDESRREYVNAVNADNVRLTSRNLNWRFRPWELKIQNIQSTARSIILPFAEYHEEDGVGVIARVFRRLEYWQHSYELAVQLDLSKATGAIMGKYGWHHVVLDQGFNTRSRPGFPDGSGGGSNVNASQVFPENSKVPLTQAVTDLRGFTYSQPVPLDGKGGLQETDISRGVPLTKQGVAIVYDAYHALPFTPLNL